MKEGIQLLRSKLILFLKGFLDSSGLLGFWFGNKTEIFCSKITPSQVKTFFWNVDGRREYSNRGKNDLENQNQSRFIADFEKCAHYQNSDTTNKN